jgi:SAM-dependent methyltransferase
VTSYFAEPEFAEAFSASREATAAFTASRIIELAGIAPGQRVVDLCCGPGLVSKRLGEAVGPTGEVTGVDASAAMVDLARKNVPAANARFIEGNAYDLSSLITSPVDCVVATSAWQNFLLDKERIVAAVRAVLKPGGRLAFDIRLRDSPEASGEEGTRPPFSGFRERITTLLREEYPDVAIQEQEAGPFGVSRASRQPYRRDDIDRDVALMERNGFRLAKREDVPGGPFAGAWYSRPRWRVDYWLSRTAPGLSAEGRARLLDRVSEEVAARRRDRPRQVVTVYLVMEAVPQPG